MISIPQVEKSHREVMLYNRDGGTYIMFAWIWHFVALSDIFATIFLQGGPIVSLPYDFLGEHVSVHVRTAHPFVYFFHHSLGIIPEKADQIVAVIRSLQQFSTADNELCRESLNHSLVFFRGVLEVITSFYEVPNILVPRYFSFFIFDCCDHAERRFIPLLDN